MCACALVRRRCRWRRRLSPWLSSVHNCARSQVKCRCLFAFFHWTEYFLLLLHNFCFVFFSFFFFFFVLVSFYFSIFIFFRFFSRSFSVPNIFYVSSSMSSSIFIVCFIWSHAACRLPVSIKRYKPWYLEECSSTLATTYSSGTPGHDKSVATVDMDGRLRPDRICTVEHTGTSASAPLAAGICALALEANPTLTWRDLQYLVVLTSNPEPLQKENGWIYNGVRRKVSHKFGYGLMDAGQMVSLAEKWTPVPSQHICRCEYIPLCFFFVFIVYIHQRAYMRKCMCVATACSSRIFNAMRASAVAFVRTCQSRLKCQQMREITIKTNECETTMMLMRPIDFFFSSRNKRGTSHRQFGQLHAGHIHGCEWVREHRERSAISGACAMQNYVAILSARQFTHFTHLAHGHHQHAAIRAATRRRQEQFRRLAIFECALLGWKGRRSLDTANHKWRSSARQSGGQSVQMATDILRHANQSVSHRRWVAAAALQSVRKCEFVRRAIVCANATIVQHQSRCVLQLCVQRGGEQSRKIGDHTRRPQYSDTAARQCHVRRQHKGGATRLRSRMWSTGLLRPRTDTMCGMQTLSIGQVSISVNWLDHFDALPSIKIFPSILTWLGASTLAKSVRFLIEIPFLSVPFIHSTCVSRCPPRSFPNQEGVCWACHESCETCAGAGQDSCLTCAPAHLHVIDLAICMQVCPDGYYESKYLDD